MKNLLKKIDPSDLTTLNVMVNVIYEKFRSTSRDPHNGRRHEDFFRISRFGDAIKEYDVCRIARILDEDIKLMRFKDRDSSIGTAFRISFPDDAAWEEFKKFRELLSKQKKIATPPSEDEPVHFPHKVPRGTKWEQFIITFLDTENIAIDILNKRFARNFSEMGFVDKRNGKPNVQWSFLLVLAKNGGRLVITDDDSRQNYKKQKQLLSDTLMEYFSMGTDPFETYTPADGYKIRCSLFYAENSPKKSFESPLDDLDDHILESMQ